MLSEPVNQLEESAFTELYSLHRAHLVTAVTPYAFAVVEVQVLVLVPESVSGTHSGASSAPYAQFRNMHRP